MDIDHSSFNRGRRRTFDEFAEGEEVQVDRINQSLYARIPVPLAHSVSPFVVPNDSRTADLPREPSLHHQHEQRALSWPQALMQTIAVSAVVIVVLSAHVCRTTIRQAARTGRSAYENGQHIRQTCTAVVQSSYGSTKRRIVIFTDNIPAFPRYRRRLPPSSSPSSPPRTPPHSPRGVVQRQAPPRSSPDITSGRMPPENEGHIQGQYDESTQGEPIEWDSPDTPPEIISADAESTLPYMMTGALPTADPEDFEFDSAIELEYNMAFLGGNDDYDSDESYVTAEEYMEEEEDTFFDVSSDTSDDKPSSPAYRFEEPDLLNPVFDQLTRAHTHRVVVPPTPTRVQRDSSSSSVRPDSSAPTENPSTVEAPISAAVEELTVLDGDLWGVDDAAAVSHGEISLRRTTGSPLPGADRPVRSDPAEGTAGSLVAQADRPAVSVPSCRRRRTEMPTPRRVQPPRQCRRR